MVAFSKFSKVLLNLVVTQNEILLAGPILDLLCVRQSDAAPFYEHFAKLYFAVKHFEKDLDRGNEIFGAFFSKQLPVLANIGRYPDFLD